MWIGRGFGVEREETEEVELEEDEEEEWKEAEEEWSEEMEGGVEGDRMRK